jgi:hypothetical protein
VLLKSTMPNRTTKLKNYNQGSRRASNNIICVHTVLSLFTKHNYRAKNNVYLFNYENKLIYNFKIFIFLLINLIIFWGIRRKFRKAARDLETGQSSR